MKKKTFSRKRESFSSSLSPSLLPLLLLSSFEREKRKKEIERKKGKREKKILFLKRCPFFLDLPFFSSIIPSPLPPRKKENRFLRKRSKKRLPPPPPFFSKQKKRKREKRQHKSLLHKAKPFSPNPPHSPFLQALSLQALSLSALSPPPLSPSPLLLFFSFQKKNSLTPKPPFAKNFKPIASGSDSPQPDFISGFRLTIVLYFTTNRNLREKKKLKQTSFFSSSPLPPPSGASSSPPPPAHHPHCCLSLSLSLSLLSVVRKEEAIL